MRTVSDGGLVFVVGPIAVTAVLNIRRRREEVSLILREGGEALPPPTHHQNGIFIPFQQWVHLRRPPTGEMGFLSHFGGGFASAAPPHPTHH